MFNISSRCICRSDVKEVVKSKSRLFSHCEAVSKASSSVVAEVVPNTIDIYAMRKTEERKSQLRILAQQNVDLLGMLEREEAKVQILQMKILSMEEKHSQVHGQLHTAINTVGTLEQEKDSLVQQLQSRDCNALERDNERKTLVAKLSVWTNENEHLRKKTQHVCTS